MCEGQGTVRWDKNQIDLKGHGYHDYNCGSGNLKKVLNYWFWGKYFFENRWKYETPPRVTFTQVYFSIDTRGVEEAIQAAQALIKEGSDPYKVTTFGDASILSPGCAQCSVREIRNQFGTDLAEAIKNMKPGSWYGPVKSTYGIHAVYIHDRQDTKLPNYRDIIDRIKNDWMSAKREENTRRVYDEIRSRYRVLVEGLPYDFDWKE